MKKALVLLVFFTYLSIGYSQTHFRDSLKLLLQKEKTDTGRVILLCNLSFDYHESDLDTAMSLAIEALSLSRKINFATGEALSLNRVSNAYYSFGNYTKAMECLIKARKILEKIKNIDGLPRTFANIGLIYSRQGNYRQALEFFFKGLDLGEKIADKKSVSTSYANIGETYYRLKIYDSAKVFIQESNNIASSINYSRITGNSLRIMGDIHSATGQQVLSLEYYRLSIPYLRESQLDLSLSETFLGMAELFEKNGQHDSALSYSRQSLNISKNNNFSLGVRDAGRFLSLFYRNNRNADSAFFYQDITKVANDSLFNEQKSRQLQSMDFEERMRQSEIAIAGLKDKIKRKHNLQYAAIAIGLIFFIILFFALSHSIVVKTRFISFFAILGLLAVFEFINLFVHPYLSHATNDSPVLMLLVLIAIGALLIPLHHKLEKWITNVMTEKNKKIRLAAAEKTIRVLSDHNKEGKQIY